MPHSITKRGRFWHYTITVAGRRLRRSTGAEDKKIAERIASEAEAKEWRRHLDGPGADVTMAQVFAAYIDAGKSDRFLDPLIDHWKDTLLSQVTPEAIRASSRKIYPNAANATWNRQVIVPTQAAINYTCRLLGMAELKVSRFKVATVMKEPATPEWVEAFCDQADVDDLPHLAALCRFMFGTGARIGEAVSLKWSDIDFEAKEALIRQTKVGSERTAHLQSALIVSLANIPSNRNPDDLVFGYAARDSVRQVWDNVIRRASIDRLTPHSCRHGFATTLLRRGIDVKTVANLGGWKDARTVLETYAHAIEDSTLTDSIFDTFAPRNATHDYTSHYNKREIS
ncbi:MAG: site-specific integrase [Paracoccaceae bacterium]